MLLVKVANMNMKVLHYEIDDFYLPPFKFVNKQKSLILANHIEYDCFSENDEIIIIRTPICKCVYYNGLTIILQIVKTGLLYKKFIETINNIEHTYKINDSLIKCNENNISSMVLLVDTDAFTWFERERPIEKIISSTTKVKTSVVAILYIDKKVSSIYRENDTTFRWRCFQVRDVFLQKRKCMIRFKNESESETEDNNEFDDIFYVNHSSNLSLLSLTQMNSLTSLTLPPPPPPPPLPPVFKMNTEIIVKKKQLVEKLKKESSNLFVVSQDELNLVLERLRKSNE